MFGIGVYAIWLRARTGQGRPGASLTKNPTYNWIGRLDVGAIVFNIGSPPPAGGLSRPLILPIHGSTHARMPAKYGTA